LSPGERGRTRLRAVELRVAPAVVVAPIVQAAPERTRAA
jgi:hypothetical protein